MTFPTRPLRGPTVDDLRYAFSVCGPTPPALLDFMATIGPVVGDPFIVRAIAVSVSVIGAMKAPERKVKHLDDLLSEVNFPPEVARAINAVVDRIEPCPEQVNLAGRLVPPLENLAGAILSPPFPVSEEAARQVITAPLSRRAYDEAMTGFETLRNDLLDYLSYSLAIHTVAPESMREEGLRKAIEYVPQQLAIIDLAAGIVGMTLHHPETWPKEKATRMQLVATLNAAKARDAAAQEELDANGDIAPVRRLQAAIDDLVIDHCQRAIRARRPDLRTFPFWLQVLRNSPLPVA